MRSTILLLAAAACSNGGLSAQEPPTAKALRSVLAVLSDSSMFASSLHVDPRVLSHAEAFTVDEAASLPEETIRSHRRVIRDAGYAEGDFFLAVACDPSGRETIIKGADTLARPALPPMPSDLQEKCLLASDDPVLILTLPEEADGFWRLRAHIVGVSAGEFWRFTIAADGTIQDVERLMGWRT